MSFYDQPILSKLVHGYNVDVVFTRSINRVNEWAGMVSTNRVAIDCEFDNVERMSTLTLIQIGYLLPFKTIKILLFQVGSDIAYGLKGLINSGRCFALGPSQDEIHLKQKQYLDNDRSFHDIERELAGTVADHDRQSHQKMVLKYLGIGDGGKRKKSWTTRWSDVYIDSEMLLRAIYDLTELVLLVDKIPREHSSSSENISSAITRRVLEEDKLSRGYSRQGVWVGVVLPCGGGKTTIVRVLTQIYPKVRFYDIDTILGDKDKEECNRLSDEALISGNWDAHHKHLDLILNRFIGSHQGGVIFARHEDIFRRVGVMNIIAMKGSEHEHLSRIMKRSEGEMSAQEYNYATINWRSVNCPVIDMSELMSTLLFQLLRCLVDLRTIDFVFESIASDEKLSHYLERAVFYQELGIRELSDYLSTVILKNIEQKNQVLPTRTLAATNLRSTGQLNVRTGIQSSNVAVEGMDKIADSGHSVALSSFWHAFTDVYKSIINNFTPITPIRTIVSTVTEQAAFNRLSTDQQMRELQGVKPHLAVGVLCQAVCSMRISIQAKIVTFTVLYHEHLMNRCLANRWHEVMSQSEAFFVKPVSALDILQKMSTLPPTVDKLTGLQTFWLVAN